MIFIHYRQAYDSIQRERLFEILYEFGIAIKVIRVVQTTMTNPVAQIQVQNMLLEPITISRGQNQSDGLTSTLFNIAFDCVVRKLTINNSNIIFNKGIQIVAYADNISIRARTLTAVQDTFIELDTKPQDMGLKINMGKQKC